MRFHWSTQKSLRDFTTGPGLNNNVHLESFVNIFQPVHSHLPTDSVSYGQFESEDPIGFAGR